MCGRGRVEWGGGGGWHESHVQTWLAGVGLGNGSAVYKTISVDFPALNWKEKWKLGFVPKPSIAKNVLSFSLFVPFPFCESVLLINYCMVFLPVCAKSAICKILFCTLGPCHSFSYLYDKNMDGEYPWSNTLKTHMRETVHGTYNSGNRLAANKLVKGR